MVSSQLIAHFAIFHGRARVMRIGTAARTAASTATQYPAELQNTFASLGSSHDISNQSQGLDLAQMREIVLPSGTLWVIPGSRGVCVVTSDEAPSAPAGSGIVGVGIACDHTTTADSVGEESFGYTAGVRGVQFDALVPNDCRAIRLSFANGQSETLAVTDNVTAATLPSDPTAVDLVTNDRGTISAFAGS